MAAVEAPDPFEQDVVYGLSQPRKRLPYKYLYDEVGSRLFDRITEQPEYYPARVEQTLLVDHGADMADAIGPDALLIEYGSGNAKKTRALLAHLTSPAGYVPIDISARQLTTVAEALRQNFPDIAIHPLSADFTHAFELPMSVRTVRPRVIFFPGCTIWNLELDDGRSLLKRIAASCAPDGALLIAVDLAKDERILNLAYDDPAGATAAFNRNMLRHINREVGADFAPDRFAHRARWNGLHHRMEMTLESIGEQRVTVGDRVFVLSDGEPILTEVSYKFEQSLFEEIARDAGLSPVQRWLDPAGWYSLQLLRPGRHADDRAATKCEQNARSQVAAGAKT